MWGLGVEGGVCRYVHCSRAHHKGVFLIVFKGLWERGSWMEVEVCGLSTFKKGIVLTFGGKYLLLCRELDDKIDTTVISEGGLA